MIANKKTIHNVQMTSDQVIIGQRTAFNNEKHPFCIVNYISPDFKNVKPFKRENQRPYSEQKNI